MMRCSRSLGVVDRALSVQFHRLGLAIGRRPGYFLLVPVLLSLLAATGVQQLRYQDDPEYLFSPETGRAKTERALANRLFPSNFSAFNPGRITDSGHFVRLMVTAPGGGSLLHTAAFDELVQLDRLVRAVEVDAGEEQWHYDQLCASWGDACLDNVALRLQPYVAGVESGAINLTFPVWFSDSFDMLLLAGTLGSPQLQDGVVTAAPALQMFYWVGNHVYFDVSVSLKWEMAVQEMLAGTTGQFQHINVSRFGSQTLKQELDTNTVKVIPYMAVTVGLMIVFCVITTMMSDWVRAKPLLGLMGVASAVFGSGTAFGVLMYCQLEFIGINLAAPFLMLGIGMDDTFVMLAAWRRTPIQDPVPQRMAKTYQDAAVSITITSLTNIISFLVGSISPFPSVRIFCIYTGLSVLMTYLWHVLFFGACMALSGYAERRNLHAVTFKPTLPVSESGSKSLAYRLFCSGGISETDPWNKNDNREHTLMVFFRDGVARALNIPAVKGLT
ncbi:patched domain-containing protein 3-like [Pollicipes pollicipes]|uniref:patched domain-containing protein 3-like n=1 Tax=Pollicipes pollicipes TaxID=41117 RepID=UPI0018851C49|nr:patched domain-containing protein 3-like [Pollicipes pollicipes]